MKFCQLAYVIDLCTLEPLKLFRMLRIQSSTRYEHVMKYSMLTNSTKLQDFLCRRTTGSSIGKSIVAR